MKPTIKAFVKDATKEQIENFIYELLKDFPWDWYVKHFKDLIDAKIENGLWHYLWHGYREKRLKVDISFMNPSPPDPTPPTPGGWKPPTKSGVVFKDDSGAFCMGGLRIPEGILAGYYRDQARTGAKIKLFNGELKDEAFFPRLESAYSLRMAPDGLPICTTELYGSVYKRMAPGQWEKKFSRPEFEALLFETYEFGGGLVALRTNCGGNSGLIKGDINGTSWGEWKQFSGVNKLNMGTDGRVIRIAGYNPNPIYPVLFDENGNKVIDRSDFVDCKWAFVIGANGVWNMGGNNKDYCPDGAYIDVWDGSVCRSVLDVPEPWVMRMAIHNGVRYALSSHWDEKDLPARLSSSTDGYNWKTVTTIPMPFCTAMVFADGGVYLIGGKYGQYGMVYFFKF